jgi:hypothetical protein
VQQTTRKSKCPKERKTTVVCSRTMNDLRYSAASLELVALVPSSTSSFGIVDSVVLLTAPDFLFASASASS